MAVHIFYYVISEAMELLRNGLRLIFWLAIPSLALRSSPSLLNPWRHSACVQRYCGSRKIYTLRLYTQQPVKQTSPLFADEDFLHELPIFPLRKYPRLPTDHLTLNLYEERYIQMAKFILSSSSPFFGAMYVAGKPQIATAGGHGPVVPLIEPGDIGTLFSLLPGEWEDAIVPTAGDQMVRRRIKLNSIGVARYRIEEIISDGTAFDISQDENTAIDAIKSSRPFVLVKAALLVDDEHDDTLAVDSTNEKFESLLNTICQTSTSLQWLSPILGGEWSHGKEHLDSQILFAEVYSVIEAMAFPWTNSKYCKELLSFFLASRIINAKHSPRKMVPLLEQQSTRNRINSLLRYRQK